MLKKTLVFTLLSAVFLTLNGCSELNLEFEDMSAHNKKRNISARQRAAYLARKNRSRGGKRPYRRHAANKRHTYKKPYRRTYATKRRSSYKHSGVKKYVLRNGSGKVSPFANSLSNAALGRLRAKVRYDGSYFKIGYPNGDVPANRGVCTDVVIRSYRKLGIDLQKEVHNDMKRSFSSYPKKWGLSEPDTNIDHRRVTNLRTYFTRHRAKLAVTHNPADYKAGDIVTWDVPPGRSPHIGIVVNKASPSDPRRRLIVHNIADGPELADILFAYPITGHYRFSRRNL